MEYLLWFLFFVLAAASPVLYIRLRRRPQIGSLYRLCGRVRYRHMTHILEDESTLFNDMKCRVVGLVDEFAVCRIFLESEQHLAGVLLIWRSEFCNSSAIKLVQRNSVDFLNRVEVARQQYESVEEVERIVQSLTPPSAP